MKKRVLTALISILMIFVIAGCSNSGNSNQTAQNGNGNRAGFQKPDVYGEVSAINGNQVTLKLMNIPQMNRGAKGQVRGSGTGNMGTSGAAPGKMNGNVNGNGGPGKGGMRQRSYTGEEKTITIPNGVQMTTMTRGTNGMEQNTVTLDQITTGSTLSIYYDTDGKTIKSIRVQKPWTGNGQGSNGQTGNTAS
jgi:hypothetical protein